MDGKTLRGPKRSVLAAKEKANGKDVENSKPAQRKSKAADRIQLPILVAGKEVLGRELSVFKNSNKSPLWIKGAVKEFDEPSVCHKIQYKQPLPECAGEEWLCLGKSMFMWTDEDFICPFANPTYSARYTPRKEDAVGQRVKVFWTAMGKWYQGKVIEYDASTGKHRVYFKDGDEKRCLLRQEALVWLDIPELCSDTAIRVMRQEEGEPLPLAAIREEEGEDGGAQGSSSSLQQQVVEKGKSSGKAVTNGKRKGRGGAKDQSDATSQDRKRMVDRPKSTAKDQGRPGRFSKATSEAHTAASGSREAPTTSTGVETNARRASGHAADDSKSASSSSHEPEEGQDAAGKATRKQKDLPQASSKGAADVNRNADGSKAAEDSQPFEEASRKRSRLGMPVLAVSQPEPKRKAAAKPAAKVVRKPKKAMEDSRLGGRRQKTAADVHFEEACQAVLGSRVGVWWEDDRCYYKGQIVAHDWYHKRLKVLYDDGVEEFIVPHKRETQFTWLTPRAQTAGATDTVHAAFKLLQAGNAGADVGAAAPVLEAGPGVGASPSSTTPAMASVQTVSHTADGSHLDALVPLRPSSAASGKGEEGMRGSSQPNGPINGTSLPHPVDSTTRALPSQAKNGVLLGVSTPAAWPAPLRSLPGTPATARSSLGLTGLQAMVPPSSLPQTVPAAALLHHRLLAPSGMPAVASPLLPQQRLPPSRPAAADRQFAMTPDAGAKAPIKLFAQTAPAGQTAEGWKVSLVFRGNNQIYQGRVLTFDPKQGRHHVLWDDGEDEWVDVTREPLTWHADRLKTTGFSAGLSSGQPEPKGEEMIGWRIAVYWKEEQQFYEGTVEDYDSELDQHTVSYMDGDELCESLCGQIFKFVLPPTVQVVGARRISTRKRAESGDRDDAPRRTRRRHRSKDDDDEDYVEEDSDAEWGRHIVIDRKPTVRQLSQLQREVSTPAVTTPRTCDIRRLNSKVGSLLVYEGEENHVDLVASGNSPKFTPIAGQLPELQSAEPDPRGRPVIDRRISGLKSAQGFRLPVRRVRVYLPGGASGKMEDTLSEGAAVGEKCGSLGGQSSSVPTQDTLQQMLKRVDTAHQSMQKGMPAGSLMVLGAFRAAKSGEAQNTNPGPSEGAGGAGSAEKPAEAPASAAPMAAAAEEVEDQIMAEVHESPPQQEEHATPPSSPFAPYAAKRSGSFPEGSDDMQLDEQSEAAVVPSQKCCDVQSSRAVPVLVNGSLSLPQTPSAISEGHVGPSRNGSIISGSMLAELAQARAVVQAVVAPKAEDVEHVLG